MHLKLPSSWASLISILTFINHRKYVFYYRWYGFYNDDEQLPILERGKLTYTKQELATILLEHKFLAQHRKVSTRQPSHISSSVSCLVDSEMLDDSQDLTTDDMGALISHSTPQEYVHATLYIEDNRVKHIACNPGRFLTTEEFRKLGMINPVAFILSRKYGKCKASPDLRRMTTKLQVADTERSGHFIDHKFALVQYTFSEGDHNVSIIPHRNAKGTSIPYTKTKASVKRQLETVLTSATPSRAVSQVDANHGGYMMASSSSDLCRNNKQAWNLNQKRKHQGSSFVPLQFEKKDELSEVMKRCKGERKGEEFVREVVAAPEPRCVLADKRQINDLVSFCCAERPNHCVLGVDPTFNLGEFYVTFTVYRHLALVNDCGMHPLFLGPCLIHHRKLYSTSKDLPQVLGNIDPATKLVKIYRD
jgi:hypothetical protein